MSYRFRPQLDVLEDRLAPATTINVTTRLDVVDAGDGKISLREAINLSNATPALETITLKAGEYKITLPDGGADDNAGGDFDVTNSVIIKGIDAEATFIDGNLQGRLFEILGAPEVQFKKMTLRNGNSAANGGAVHALTADIILKKCVVSGNWALFGGGINTESGDVVLSASTVIGNLALDTFGDGGGIRAPDGMVQVVNSEVRGNIANRGAGGILANHVGAENSTINDNVAGGSGGGMVAQSVTLTDCIVSQNSAANGSGGGISAESATLRRTTLSANEASVNGGGIFAELTTLIDSTVVGNRSQLGGGGIFGSSVLLDSCMVTFNHSQDAGGGVLATNLMLTDSTVSLNTAKLGGGLFATKLQLSGCTVSGNDSDMSGGGVFATDALIINCTVSGNKAGSEGGGIYADKAGLLNVTITKNTAVSGGGVVHHGATSDFKVKNTIIAQNAATGLVESPDLQGTFTSVGNNLIGIGFQGSGFTQGVMADKVGAFGAPLDPRLGPLQNNDGPTLTHALKSGSPAIDAGNNTETPGTDQRGLPRRKDGDGNGSSIVDIGAFER